MHNFLQIFLVSSIKAHWKWECYFKKDFNLVLDVKADMQKIEGTIIHFITYSGV